MTSVLDEIQGAHTIMIGKTFNPTLPARASTPERRRQQVALEQVALEGRAL